jgi:hypothetical protein
LTGFEGAWSFSASKTNLKFLQDLALPHLSAGGEEGAEESSAIFIAVLTMSRQASFVSDSCHRLLLDGAFLPAASNLLP